jgi:hypothetical protein
MFDFACHASISVRCAEQNGSKEIESTTWQVNRVARIREPAASFFFFLLLPLSSSIPTPGWTANVLRRGVCDASTRIDSRRSRLETRRCKAWPMGPRTPDSSLCSCCKFAELAGASIADTVMCGYLSKTGAGSSRVNSRQPATLRPEDTN